MEQILKWLSEYSWPVVLLLVVGAIFIYLVKLITEKAVSNEFDKVKKMTELVLEKRSNFQEKVLLDRYNVAVRIHSKIAAEATNAGRVRGGQDLATITENGKIVGLNEVFELLSNNKYLLPRQIYDALYARAKIVHELYYEPNPTKESPLIKRYMDSIESFGLVMNDFFLSSGETRWWKNET